MVFVMAIINSQQPRAFGVWANQVHEAFSSIPFPIGDDNPNTEITFDDVGTMKDLLMYHTNVLK